MQGFNIETSCSGAPCRLTYAITGTQEGSSQNHTRMPCVSIVAVVMDPFLVIHATISNKQTHVPHTDARLSYPDQTNPVSSSTSNGGSSTLDPLPAVGSGDSSMPSSKAATVAQKRQPPLTLTLNSAVHIASAPIQQGLKPQQVPLPGGTSAPSSPSFVDVQRLWRALRDSLALKLLAGVYLAAGLPSPYGLLALPSEVEVCVLQLLPVSGSWNPVNIAD